MTGLPKVADIALVIILLNDVCERFDALCKFGDEHRILQKIAITGGLRSP